MTYFQTNFKKTKYNNVRQTYGSYNYDSKKEARQAAELDLLVKAKQIKSWERQFKISLDVNGKHICNYYCDFRIENNDGTYELLEIKSPITVTPIYNSR